MGRLIGVRREEPPSLKAALECDVDRRSCGLKADARRGGLAQGAADSFSVLVEYQDVGRERVFRIEVTGPESPLFVAQAGQAMPGFEHIHLEFLRIAEEGDPGRRIQI